MDVCQNVLSSVENVWSSVDNMWRSVENVWSSVENKNFLSRIVELSRECVEPCRKSVKIC